MHGARASRIIEARVFLVVECRFPCWSAEIALGREQVLATLLDDYAAIDEREYPIVPRGRFAATNIGELAGECVDLVGCDADVFARLFWFPLSLQRALDVDHPCFPGEKVLLHFGCQARTILIDCPFDALLLIVLRILKIRLQAPQDNDAGILQAPQDELFGLKIIELQSQLSIELTGTLHHERGIAHAYTRPG